MILEVAVLDIRPGRAEAFEAAFREAQNIVSARTGYRGHELQKCLEVPDRYLLLVRWNSLEDHTEGFRGSPEYRRWSALLHPFYDPFPEVDHYVEVEVRAEGAVDGCVPGTPE